MLYEGHNFDTAIVTALFDRPKRVISYKNAYTMSKSVDSKAPPDRPPCFPSSESAVCVLRGRED